VSRPADGDITVQREDGSTFVIDGDSELGKEIARVLGIPKEELVTWARPDPLVRAEEEAS
jgi:hypothetical protein